jgi:CRISPR/Cas system CSM-associated protein Csm3 (group 7 of RAMP superfamily)
MSRNIARRVIVEGRLVCQTPISVGGLDSRSGSDLPLAVNGEGKFYAPGTSLAGPLRAWCAEAFTPEEADALWGPRDANAGHASYVIVEDAVIEAGAIAPELRDGVGIDRYTGAAADKAKFDREILPAGTALPFRLLFEELREDKTNGAAILAALLQALQAGEVHLGAARSRGLGKVKLEGLKVLERKFDSRDGILASLRGGAQPSESLEALCADWKDRRRQRPVIRIRIGWRPNGPMMVKSAVDGMVVDALPLLSQKGGALHFALPGSSTKGALRSQAERIVTTLLDPRTPEGEPETPEGKKFPKQLARFSIVTHMFGAPNAPASADDKDKTWLPGLSPLSVEDCFSKSEISAQTLDHMLSGGEGGKDLPDWTKALPQYQYNTDGRPYFDPSAHVAIDRWTGGASDGALFSVLQPWNFQWSALMLAIDPNRLPRRAGEDGKDDIEEALAAIALLLLTLADFVKGETPLGFGTNRGFGSVTVNCVSMEIPEAETCRKGFVRDVLASLQDLRVEIMGGRLKLEGEAVLRLRKAWTQYLKQAAEVPQNAGRMRAQA